MEKRSKGKKEETAQKSPEVLKKIISFCSSPEKKKSIKCAKYKLLCIQCILPITNNFGSLIIYSHYGCSTRKNAQMHVHTLKVPHISIISGDHPQNQG